MAVVLFCGAADVFKALSVVAAGFAAGYALFAVVVDNTVECVFHVDEQGLTAERNVQR